MKFRYLISVQIGVLDAETKQPIIPYEQFSVEYDSPIKLNPLNPLDQGLMKRVAKVCFENRLLEEDRLKELGLNETITDVTHIDHKYVKQIRSSAEAL